MKQTWVSVLCFLLISCCGSEPQNSPNSEQMVPVPVSRPLPPEEAPGHMKLPKGFKATLFAGEPDVVQPIAFTIDDRGRLWVAQCLSYPNWQKTGKDSIIIFEDSKGTGRFDKRTVFKDNIANISGLQLGFGGVWVTAIPNLMFIPIREDGTAGEPEIHLDGWCKDQIATPKMAGKHHVPNSLTWGPDGWLYGCGGITAPCNVGKPGTKAADRTPFKGGVWRYHPTRRQFEVVAAGTTNPWGLDFDDYGEMFITNNVTQHLFHVIPGAHFMRSHGQDFNPNVYGLLEGCADHLHYAGSWKKSREKVHGDTGGGHSHAGAMIYLGDNWPAEFRNNIFMCNLHGSRINRDILERLASGYTAKHAEDFMLANDPWFRGLALQYGPDGGVFVSDWTDTGECHNVKEIDRSNGRIYKITHGTPAPWSGNVAALSDAELVERQLHRNDWHVRHARRVLQERAAAGKLAPETVPSLRKMLKENPDVTRKLRALWALHVTGGLDEQLLREQLDSPEETIRAWAVRLGLEGRQASEKLLDNLIMLASTDLKPLVRLSIASGLQRLPIEQRWKIAEELIQHVPDTGETNLPLTIWYGIEPLVQADREKALAMILKAKIPIVREYVARRVTLLAPGTDSVPSGLSVLVKLLDSSDDAALQADVLRGMEKGLQGDRVEMPRDWPMLYRKLSSSDQAGIRRGALKLAVLFGDKETLDSLRKLMMDPNARMDKRLTALKALAEVADSKDTRFAEMLHTLVKKESGLRLQALNELWRFHHAATPEVIIDNYAAFTTEEKTAARRALVSRPTYALALLETAQKGRIPKRDLTAEDIRRLSLLRDKKVTAELDRMKLVLPPPPNVAAAKARWKALLTPVYLKRADLANGRLVFKDTCSGCHKLFDDGGDVGPDLTGSQRHDLDYVLDKVLDPSAIVPEDSRLTTVFLKNGVQVEGIVRQRNKNGIVLLVRNGPVVVPTPIPTANIEVENQSTRSIMPEDLFEPPMTPAQVRDLIAYLASQQQVPLPTPKKAATNK